MGRTSSKAKNRWNAANYDQVALYIPKGTRDQLHTWCAENGKTLGGLVKELLQERTGIRLINQQE